MSAGTTTKAHEVRVFVAAFCAVDLGGVRPATRLREDLGVDGDDSDDLLREFAAKFHVDLMGYDHGAHFAGEGMWPWTPLVALWQVVRHGNVSDERAPLSVGRLIRAAEGESWRVDKQ